MPVTGEQVTALRAFLAFDPVYERLTRELAASGRWPGFGELVYSAFATAVRRRFAPTWTSAQVVRFTAQVRNGLRTEGVDLDPLATEILIRQALGERVTSSHDDNAQAQVMMFVLGELMSEEHLDESGLDAFLAEARAMANARLAAQAVASGPVPDGSWSIRPATAAEAGIGQISLSVERKNFARGLYLSEGFAVVDASDPQSDTMIKSLTHGQSTSAGKTRGST